MRVTTALFTFIFLLLGKSLSAQQVPARFSAQVRGLQPFRQVEVLDSLAREYYKSEPVLCVDLLKAAIYISNTNQLDTVEIQERMNLNRQYRYHGKNDSAMFQIDTALLVAHNGKYVEWEEEILSARGVLFMRMGLYEEATASFVEGMDLARANNDAEQLAILNRNWGSLYFYTTDFEAAIERTQEALRIFTELKDTVSIAACVDNIGLYFSNMSKWDSAYTYQLKALKIFEAQSDSGHLMVCYNNLGSTLLQMKSYGLAKSYLLKSLGMAERRGLDYECMTTLTTMAELYQATGEIKAGQTAALRAYELALKQENSFYALQSTEMLAMSYYREKNFERSAYYFLITDSLRQEVFDTETTKASEEAQKKYKAQEQKQKIALLESENVARTAQNERDVIIKWATAGIGILLLIFSVVVFRNYNRKKRDNDLLQLKNAAIEEQKAIIEVKNQEITDSINYATRIQNAVLPAADKLNALFPNNFIYFRPRDIISGDFYWAAEGRNGVRYVAVADCTGHGVPGAMMSMLGAAILNRVIVKKNVTTPGKILDTLHEELLSTLNAKGENRQVNDGMDIALMMFDVQQRKLIIASADRPVYFVRNGSLETIAADKISIGSSLPKSNPYSEHTIELDTDISLFLFSDGIVDQFGGPDRKKFMSKRLKDLVTTTQALPISERAQEFATVFDQWKDGMEQTDDMTLINIEIRKNDV